MAAYYNEHDPFAAAWLRELIADNLIAPGEVDERSIEDVTPDDLRPFRQCHFFAGVGVWSLAARLVGIDDDAPLWTGSCPCQPFSTAGKGAGFADERHLWPAFHYLIEQSGPLLVAGEQVAGNDGDAWLDLVSADMEATGYAFGCAETVACGFGAPHKRTRNYWVAHRIGARLERHRRHVVGPREPGRVGEVKARSAAESGVPVILADAGGQGRTQQRWRRDEPTRSAEVGSSGRMDDASGARHLPTGSGEPGEVEADERVGRGLSGVGRNGGSVDDAQRDGWRAGRRDHRGHERVEPDTTRPLGGVADADGGRASDGNTQPSGQFGLVPQDGGAGWPRDRWSQLGPARRVERPGPVNGLWRDADWLRCRDEKWRPVEPGAFPLVDAGAFRNRVGLLRGAGNAVTLGQAAGFLEAVCQSLGI